VTGVTVVGVRGHLVAVEAHVGRGLPSLTLTGLPGAVSKPSTTCSDALTKAQAASPKVAVAVQRITHGQTLRENQTSSTAAQR